MGESTCLMQVQPFSYVSGFPNEAKEEKPIHALGQSVSFGRFMSESLAWEKWSSFSHNKYVEEAERYARPGSVAQKKAFFEAHYKEIAARKKAAALLEQAQDASNNNVAAESELEGEVDNVAAQEEARANEYDSNFLVDKSETKKVLGEESVDDVKEIEPSGTEQMENCVEHESSNQLGVVDSEREVKDLKLSGTTQMEKPQLKSSNSNQDDRVSMSKKKSSFSSSKSLSFGRAAKRPSTPAKPTASSQFKKEIIATPIKKSEIDSADKRRSTPKSIHKSTYLTPAREINRLTSTIIRKIDGSKVMGSNSKASKDCATPLRTPTTASVNGAPKHPLATPWSGNRRDRTPHDSTTGTKTVRARWNFLPTDCSKFLSACRKKLQSPNSFTPFHFRTEERAARRKKKLEDKFNASQTKKLQEQAKLKEKAETEIRKQRQTLCFKARPLPDFYKERATPNSQMKKDPPTQPQSPKLMPSTVQRKPSTPRQRPPTKYTGSNHVLEKKIHASTRSLISRSTKIARENTSPNIQHE